MVPFGYYEFPVVIVRNNEGGVCEVLHPHKFACEMLRASGLMGPLTTTGDGGGKPPDVLACMDMMNRWYRQACAEMFPPLEHNNTRTGSDAVTGDEERSGSVGGNKEGYVIGGVDAGGRSKEKQRQRDTTSGGRGKTTIRESATTPLATAAATEAHIVSFQEATGLVKGIRRDLSDLLGTMTVHVTPKQDRREYFLAHHYPFHHAQTNPLNRERGLLDQIAIIEGYSLSEADFNRLALAFSCFLSDTSSAGAGREAEEGWGQQGGTLSSEEHEVRKARKDGGSGERDTLVLKTTAAEEGGLQAVVDCSLVESVHDVWISLLDNKFEPSQTVCRGPVEPCLERAIKESIGSVS